VNAAAYTAVDKAEAEPELCHRINAAAPGGLASAAAEIGAMLIHISTDYVFDGEKPEPYLEDDAPGPLNVYGESKLAGELAVAATGAEHLILRTSWVHAPARRNFVSSMLRLAAERTELKVIDDQFGAPTSARLIAETIGRIIERRAAGRPLQSGTYHLTASGETSWHGFARFIIESALREDAELRVTPERVLPIPASDYPTPARRPKNSRLSTHKLRLALDCELPDWREDALPTITALVRAEMA
jgi:dTDP-4-dehydrorhamnose reductase